jgi:hypothetical protein
MGWDNYTNDTDHEPAASVMFTTTPSPLTQHKLTLLQQYNTKPPLSPLIWNAQTANDDEVDKEISTSDQYITNDKRRTDKISTTNLLTVGRSSG